VSAIAGQLTFSDGSAVDDGIYTPSLTVYAVKKAYAYTSSATFKDIMTLSGFKPGQAVRVGIAGYKATTTSNIGEMIVNGVETAQWDAKTDSGSNVVYVTSLADENGDVQISVRKVSGTYAYVSGVSVDLI
jgi:hypothetical protein